MYNRYGGKVVVRFTDSLMIRKRTEAAIRGEEPEPGVSRCVQGSNLNPFPTPGCTAAWM